MFSNFFRLTKILFLLVNYNILPYSYLLAKPSIRRKPLGERITIVLQKLGPIFIKFGQSLSSRSDILGEQITNSLLLLCDQLPSFPYKQVKKTIQQEFKTNINELFIEFNEKPVAAASIAQVHKAITANGETVAVKILRPNIKKAFAKDLKLLLWMAKIIESLFKSSRRLKPVELVTTFAKTCKLELDLRFEAANAEELKNNLKNDTGVYVPNIYWNLTSEYIMTSEWIDAIPIYQVQNLKDRDIIARNLIMTFYNQAYRDCFFHADLHSGNLMVDSNNNIVIVDFGIMERLDRTTCIYIAEILMGFLKKDYKNVAEIHFKAGYTPRNPNFITACRAIGAPIVGKPINEISVATLLAQLFKISSDFNMQLQPQLVLLQKSIVLVEGLSRNLSSDVNMWQIAEYWLENWNKEQKQCIEQIKNTTLIKTALNLPEIINNTNKVLIQIIESHNKPNQLNKKIYVLLLVIIGILLFKILSS